MDLTYNIDTPKSDQPKAFYAGDTYNGQPSLVITSTGISLQANGTNVIAVDKDFGVMLSDRVSFFSTPEHLYFMGGTLSIDPRHISLIASTTATPIPLFRRTTPQAFKDISAFSNGLGSLTAVSDLA